MSSGDTPTDDSSSDTHDDTELAHQRLPQPHPLVGFVLAGRYEVIAPIGAGGMGDVFRARQLGVGRDVALKVVRSDLLHDETIVARFTREARAASQLQHPNTVRVYDFGQAEDGTLFLVMELLEFEPLHDILAREGAFEVDLACHIGAQVASSLTEAHGLSLVHRDLKPANVLVGRVGEETHFAKVLDFGLVKSLQTEGDGNDPQLSTTGEAMGTPRYMSPEQAAGAPVDARADLYALGVLLFEMLTGRPPFAGRTSIAVIAKHLHSAPPRLADLAPDRSFPEVLEALVADLLAKEPTQRPESASLIARELRSLAGGGLESQRTTLGRIRVGGAAAPTRVLNVSWFGERGALKLHERLNSVWRSAALPNLVDQLVRSDPYGRPLPGVVASWEQGEQGRLLRLSLRPDVRFHDHPALPGGARLAEPQDLARSICAFDRTFDLLDLEGSGTWRGGGDDWPKHPGVSIEDGVVALRFVAPSPFALLYLRGAGLIPREVEDPQTWTHPVGSGPFQLVDPPRGARFSMTASAGYWDKRSRGQSLPGVDGIEVSAVNDPVEAMAEVAHGRLHLAALNEAMVEALSERVESGGRALREAFRDKGVRLASEMAKHRSTVFVLFFVKPDDVDWMDKPFREAVAYGLQRARLSERYPGGFLPYGRLFAARLLGHDPILEGIAHDEERARRALADSAYSRASAPPFILACFADHRRLGQEAKRQLDSLGVTTRLVQVTQDTLGKTLGRKRIHGLVTPFRGLLVENEPYLFVPGLAGFVAARFGLDPRIQEQVQRMRQEMDRDAREDVLARIEELFLEELPVVPLGLIPEERPYRSFLVGEAVRDFVDDVTGRVIHRAGPPLAWVRLRS